MRACDDADVAAKEARGLHPDSERIVPRWHPHELRHNFATRMRRQYGIEAARVLLRHHSRVTTEVYAEADRVKASAIMLEVGRMGVSRPATVLLAKSLTPGAS
ncbi:MAG TPA: tyrosine-type recombinase/integrase [Phycisphaerae bacterium]|nr:tyrosine-type recombinase/integrase [Phycisphaerae bacterium]